MTTVPDVFGLPPAEAAADVDAAHLLPNFTGTGGQPSFVESQSPAAGRFARDSSLEEAGFELLVPQSIQLGRC
jgi:hypothetical protein